MVYKNDDGAKINSRHQFVSHEIVNLQPYFIVFIVMLLASFIFTYSVQRNPVAGLSFAVGIETHNGKLILLTITLFFALSLFVF